MECATGVPPCTVSDVPRAIPLCGKSPSDPPGRRSCGLIYCSLCLRYARTGPTASAFGPTTPPNFSSLRGLTRRGCPRLCLPFTITGPRDGTVDQWRRVPPTLRPWGPIQPRVTVPVERIVARSKVELTLHSCLLARLVSCDGGRMQVHDP